MTFDQPCRMLSQAAAGSNAEEQNTRLQAAVSQTQEAVAGKGILRHFLDRHLIQSNQIADACASPGFLSALGEIVR